MRLLISSALLAVVAAVPAFADSTAGTVVAFDRVDLVLVLEDLTIWEIVPADLTLPKDLKAGDEITIDFVSAGESGVSKINSITRTGG